MKYWQYIGVMGCALATTLVLSPKAAETTETTDQWAAQQWQQGQQEVEAARQNTLQIEMGFDCVWPDC